MSFLLGFFIVIIVAPSVVIFPVEIALQVLSGIGVVLVLVIVVIERVLMVPLAAVSGLLVDHDGLTRRERNISAADDNDHSARVVSDRRRAHGNGQAISGRE